MMPEDAGIHVLESKAYCQVNFSVTSFQSLVLDSREDDVKRYA